MRSCTSRTVIHLSIQWGMKNITTRNKRNESQTDFHMMMMRWTQESTLQHQETVHEPQEWNIQPLSDQLSSWQSLQHEASAAPSSWRDRETPPPQLRSSAEDSQPCEKQQWDKVFIASTLPGKGIGTRGKAGDHPDLARLLPFSTKHYGVPSSYFMRPPIPPTWLWEHLQNPARLKRKKGRPLHLKKQAEWQPDPEHM